MKTENLEKKLVFLRHLETGGNILNKDLGVKFLGRMDPSIMPSSPDSTEKTKKGIAGCTLFISSPLKRCIQTLQLLTENKIITDSNLLEIDYGDVDGLYLKQAQEKYPQLFDAWKRGEDPRFPNGENSQDVLNRYLNFIQGLKNYPDKSIAICSHNVVLRTALGHSLGISMKEWFKISIPHFEPIYFYLKECHADYIGPEEQKRRILKNFQNN
ncbi:MAG: histidine phosphatase family protein [Nanoarchaeota archaeon]|nr:histidine phosphatase family protein [Nanoarchaeota archaeon]